MGNMIFVAGGMNLDVLSFPEEEVKIRDSNPGRVIFRAGGVGHNIASRMRDMGHDTVFISTPGSGSSGRLLRGLVENEKNNLFIDCPGEAVYSAMHGADGDMLWAVNDMSAVANITGAQMRDAVSAALHAFGTPRCAALDANLPPEAIETYIGALKGKCPIIADPVSAFKAARLVPFMGSLYAIKPNMLEAEALTGCGDPMSAGKKLRQMGVKRVFISLGAKGVYYLSDDDEGICPAIPLKQGTGLTGAGDALCAGIIEGIYYGESAGDCAKRGAGRAFEALSRGENINVR